jgi:SP family general alpha glucoside:H+ symporter-like MFS transporter
MGQTTAYAIVGEVPSTRLRGKTVGLARNLYNVAGLVGGIINTYSVNPDAWNWKGRAAFFWVSHNPLCRRHR